MRWLIILALAIGLAWLGATVKLGNRTFFEHLRAIGSSPQVQDLKHGVEEKAGPAAERVKRGVQKGFEAAELAVPDGGVGPGVDASASR